MAKATKQGNEVTLTLTADEAASALYVIGCVSGSRATSRRAHTTGIYSALRNAGVRDLWAEGHGYDLFEDGEPALRFKDGSLDV